MSYAPTQSPMAARSNSSSDMSSLQVPNIQRHRKTVSTGGGRAWSDAEEAYLIETREHKMPYKHIAAQLKKTELACRLHYHQLSFGSKSRRTPSLAPIHSMRSDRSSMTPPSSLRQPTPQRPLPSFSPPESPDQSTSTPSTTISNTSDPTPLTTTTTSTKPILPRPNIPNNSPYNHHPHRSAPSSSSSTTNTNSTSSSTKRLRLTTSPLPQLGHPNEYIDLPHLDRLYDTQRLHFWSTIASAYGTGFSPATLEDAWRAHHNLQTSTNTNNNNNNGSSAGLPPTPRGSPAGETSKVQQQGVPEVCHSAVTDPGRYYASTSTSTSTTAGGFTAVNNNNGGGHWSGKRASEPPSLHQQQEGLPQSSSSSSSSFSAAYATGSSRRGGVGSIRSLLNNGGEEEVEAEQGRRLREIEKEYGDVVKRSGSASASASEGSTTPPTTGQMDGGVVAVAGGGSVVETTA